MPRARPLHFDCGNNWWDWDDWLIEGQYYLVMGIIISYYLDPYEPVIMECRNGFERRTIKLGLVVGWNRGNLRNLQFHAAGSE